MIIIKIHVLRHSLLWTIWVYYSSFKPWEELLLSLSHTTSSQNFSILGGIKDLATLINHVPVHATQLVVYHRVIALASNQYPLMAFVKWLINDLCNGCFISYKWPQFSHCATNLVSAYQHPTTIDTTVQKECQLRCILGLFQYLPLSNFWASGLGLVSKYDGRWKIIYHLSAPHISINDFIDPDDYWLLYYTTGDACNFIHKMVPGRLLSKIQLKDTFRLISIHLSQ